MDLQVYQLYLNESILVILKTVNYSHFHYDYYLKRVE